MKRYGGYAVLCFALSILLANPLYASQKMNILVYPFENTGDRDYSWISAGMTDTVIADLNRIQTISVITDDSRKKAFKEIHLGLSGALSEETAISVGKITGANLIFTGSYMVAGGRVRVVAKLVNIETGTVKKSIKIDGTVDGIFDLQDKVVFSLMAEAEKITIADIERIHFSESDKKEIADKPNPNLKAYEWYAKGLEIEETNPKQALAYYENALEIEPEYLKALLRIGFLLGDTFNRFPEALGHLNRADQIHVNRRETNTSGYASLMMNIGIVYGNKGDLDRKLEYCKKSQNTRDALGLQNTAGYASLMNNIGIVYHRKGDLDRALEYYGKSQNIRDGLGLQNTSGYANVVANIGLVYGTKGHMDKAGQQYRKAYEILDRIDYKGKAKSNYLKWAEDLGY
jgi:TolB-like protein